MLPPNNNIQCMNNLINPLAPQNGVGPDPNNPLEDLEESPAPIEQDPENKQNKQICRDDDPKVLEAMHFQRYREVYIKRCLYSGVSDPKPKQTAETKKAEMLEAGTLLADFMKTIYDGFLEELSAGRTSGPEHFHGKWNPLMIPSVYGCTKEQFSQVFLDTLNRAYGAFQSDPELREKLKENADKEPEVVGGSETPGDDVTPGEPDITPNRSPSVSIGSNNTDNDEDDDEDVVRGLGTFGKSRHPGTLALDGELPDENSEVKLSNPPDPSEENPDPKEGDPETRPTGPDPVELLIEE